MSVPVCDLSAYISFFFSLFALVNPIGMIPIFTSMTNSQSIEERNQTNFTANLAVIFILFFSLLFGNIILDVFNISLSSFRISGGILIVSIAFSMVNGKLIANIKNNKNKDIKNNLTNSIAVVPLAMPLIAGPGAISATIIWSTHYSSWINMLGCTITIVLFSCLCWCLFKIAPLIVDVIGESGINIMTRIMGLLLMAIGVEFIIIGLKSIFFSYI
ncbi:MAG: YchE family NAAT transporter [Buchnera aphidicola (Meitanaphis microgallis)]